MNKTQQKIDRRKTYLIGLDTETANGFIDENGKLNLDYSLVYDLGWAVCDKYGNIYVERSFVIYEVYVCLKEAMKSAYYAEKLPQYEKDLKSGKRKLVTLNTARKIMLEDIKQYGIKSAFAHNARFDLNALNNTIRYVTKSKYRYFFPKTIVLWDTLKMARDVICKQKTYVRFCKENGYMTNQRPPQCRATAEVLYRYITNNTDFVESHTGLEDVKIESQILAKCFQQHKKMRKELFATT